MTWTMEKQTLKTMLKGYDYLVKTGFELFDPGYFAYIKPYNMCTVIITCGIPTSGKSTWANKLRMIHTHRDDFRRYRIVSRDAIRLRLYGASYKPSSDKEKFITKVFNETLDAYIEAKFNIILDNTHCKEVYLKEALKRFDSTDYYVRIKFFDLPLWKAFIRNWKRRLRTGKYIPWNVIKAMKKNYDKINKKNYEQYAI